MITSVNNDRVKLVRALQSKRRVREKERAFVIEGHRLAQEAVRTQASVHAVYATEDYANSPKGTALIAQFSKLGVVSTTVTPQVMDLMSDTETSQGILAVLSQMAHEPPVQPSGLLIVDGLKTPGNLGAVLRTAAAVGIEAVVLTPGTVDATNPKVVRGAMGAHFYLPIMRQSWEAIRRMTKGVHVLLADVSGDVVYDNVDWRQPIALILGGEALGASEGAAQLAHARVTIPMQRGVESLNAAVAAGVLLFEMARQRGQ